MENWQEKIGNEVKSLVNIEAFAKNYLGKIKKNMAAGEPENYAIRHAKNDLRAILIDYGVKTHDIVHLLHFCGLAIYPRMYRGCGCHNYLNKGTQHDQRY